MPMKRHLYPKNWNAIARKIKEDAHWTCQECDRPCLRLKEGWFAFASKLLHEGSKWYEQTFDYVECPDTGEWGYVERKGRFILTVAHLDHNPANCDPSNLKALCSVCHLRYDAQHHAKNAKKTRHDKKHRGQLKLF